MIETASDSSSAFRIGAVSYLNTKPLVYGLAESLDPARLIYELPSRLSDSLALGKLDVALVPSIEFASNPQWSIVSDACIGCRGPVLSVKLFFRVPPAQVRTLALDEGSRTSAVMAQILLAELYGLRPQLSSLPIGSEIHTADSDAVLVIGDRAIRTQAESFYEVWDLGDRWCRWAELHQQAAAMNLPLQLVEEYLGQNLYFHLGSQQVRGLELFYERAAAWGLIEVAPKVVIDDCAIKH